MVNFVNAGLGISTYVEEGTDITEKAKYLYKFLTTETTKFTKELQGGTGDVMLTVTDEVMIELNLAKMIGDAVSVSFLGGAFTIGNLGGWRIKSGSMFVPEITNVKTTGAGETLKVVTTAEPVGSGIVAHKFIGIVGTSDSFVYANQIHGVKVEPYPGTFDVRSVAEVSNVMVCPKRTRTFKLAKVFVKKA